MMIKVISRLLAVIIQITLGVSTVYIIFKSIDLICLFCEWSDTEKYNRIKFSAFISFYNINSENWILFDDYVGYRIIETKMSYGRGYTNSKTTKFGFSFFDLLRYRRWKSQSEINKKKKKHLEEYQEVLNHIKQDIEKVNRENEQMIKEETKKYKERVGDIVDTKYGKYIVMDNGSYVSANLDNWRGNL